MQERTTHSKPQNQASTTLLTIEISQRCLDRTPEGKAVALHRGPRTCDYFVLTEKHALHSFSRDLAALVLYSAGQGSSAGKKRIVRSHTAEQQASDSLSWLALLPVFTGTSTATTTNIYSTGMHVHISESPSSG